MMLYIDPGTGSMLFSVLISLFALGYFAFRGVLIKLRLLFAGKKGAAKGKRIPFAVYNEGRQYWNTFKPVVEEFEQRGLPLVYYTSAQTDPVFDRTWQHVKPEFIGEGNKAYARLNLMEADVCLMTTPGLDVFQLKRSKGVKHYCHVVHMVNDATTYKRYGLDYFDSVLLCGDWQGEDIRYLEKLRDLSPKQLVTVGCPYLDTQAVRLKQVQPDTEGSCHSDEGQGFTVLVSPSWGASGLLSLYGEKLLDPLAETGWNIIVRTHPQSKVVEKELIARLQAKYNKNDNVIWDFDADNIVSISKADIMISDFSSITLDFAFLRDKPFLAAVGDFDARPYDAGKVPHPLWQFQVLPKIGRELKEADFQRIEEIIKNLSDDPASAENRALAKEKAWQYQGQGGKRIADYMVQVQQEVAEA
ncbi:MAG: CDP-glycerol glycerophosphotransferase family protein [Spirochaetia bacterium]|nr:CDP-glycerol glycerophosphotransferase family protein [Spirochaetia bacterium]